MKQIFTLAIFTLSTLLCSSQSLVNGSFENTSALNSCTYNISNATFNSLMNNTFAFGAYDQLDIVVSGCYIPSVPNGTYAISIANNPGNNIEGEAIALELSAPLISGTSYSLSFDAIAITDFGPQGNLLIGSSINNNSFGTEIYNAATVNTQWTSFTYTFMAPNNGTHITIMPVPGISSWNSIDNFVIESILATEHYDNESFKIYPNPTTDYIQFSGLKSIENYSIYNVLGKKVKSGNISNQEHIDIRNFTNGIYFLKFENGKAIKFIKE